MLRRLGPSVLVLALVTASCTSSRDASDTVEPTEPGITTEATSAGASAPDTAPDPSASPTEATTPVSSSDPVASDDELVAAIVERMRAGGITIVADDELVDAGASPVSMPQWQAEHLARQVSIGGGIAGQTLREAFPVPDDAVPVDALIAAWLTMDLPGANAAGGLVDTASLVDPATFVYPWAVVNLFIKDLADSGAAGSIEPSTDDTATSTVDTAVASNGFRSSFAPTRLDPCGAVQSFYQQTIGATIDALQGSDSLLGQIAGAALGLFVDKLGAAVSAAVPAAIKVIVQAIGVAAAIASAVEPWSASLIAEPTATAKGIAPAGGNPGTVTLHVATGTNDWPAPVKSCASLAGVELPKLNAEGAAVAWSLIAPDLADETGRDETIVPLSGEYQATFSYTTRVETVGANAQEVEGTMVVDGAVTRNDRAMLEKLLGTMVGNALGGLPIEVAAPLAQLAATQLAGLLEITDPVAPVAVVPVTFHVTPEDSTGASLPDLTVPASDVPPTSDCVGSVLSSEGRGGAAGVLLRLDADHTGVFDFGQSAAYNGATVRGVLTFTWTLEADGQYRTSVADGVLGILVDVGGVQQVIELGPNEIRDMDLASEEQLNCANGGITIVRTGEVYS